MRELISNSGKTEGKKKAQLCTPVVLIALFHIPCGKLFFKGGEEALKKQELYYGSGILLNCVKQRSLLLFLLY